MKLPPAQLNRGFTAGDKAEFQGKHSRRRPALEPPTQPLQAQQLSGKKLRRAQLGRAQFRPFLKQLTCL